MRSDPVRVLHVGSGNMFGGVEMVLLNMARFRQLCPELQPQFALSFEGRLSEELTAIGVPVHLLGKVRISRPWTAWRAARRLQQLLRSQPFDMVICHMPWPLAVFGRTVRTCGPRLAFWAHGAPSGRNWLELLARRITPDLAIANSRFTETGLPKLYPGVPHGVVYPPVPEDRLDTPEQRRASLRADLDVADDTIVIIQVSRLEACKGHFLHLEALARLKHTHANWVCWMVGGPQRAEEQRYLAQLQKAAVDMGIGAQVRFLGQRRDVRDLLSAADIFCQPNHTPDSFGISFVEALQCGRPVVTTAMGGALEIVDDNCGILVPPARPDLLANALQRLIASPELRRRLGRSGPIRARQLCDPAARLRQLCGLIDSACGGSRQAELMSCQPAGLE